MVDPKESLEERLKDLDSYEFRSDFVSDLEERDYSKAASYTNPYLKSDLIDSICYLLEKYSSVDSDFSKKLNIINKDELKRVYYGLISFTFKSFNSVPSNSSLDLKPSYSQLNFDFFDSEIKSSNSDLSTSDSLLEDSSYVLRAIFSNLTDWEKIYFSVGSWKTREISEFIYRPLYQNVGELIKTGIDYIHKNHMIKKNKGIYKRSLKLPESQYYRKS